MNGPLVERLIRAHVLPRMPGFTVTKRLLHVAPVCDILRGYYFESSGFDANLLIVRESVITPPPEGAAGGPGAQPLHCPAA